MDETTPHKPSRVPIPYWPLLGIAAPVALPLLALKRRRFLRASARAEQLNNERLEAAGPLALPALQRFELCVLVEQEACEGYLTDPGVSYLVETEQGRMLFDVGFGPESPTLAHNAAALGLTLDDVELLVISHLHLDHMGGMKASRAGSVALPTELGQPQDKPCLLPTAAAAPGFTPQVVEGPQMLGAGIGTTGPLARSLFFMGHTEEMALVARLEGKGLVLVTGCGHPTLELLLAMVRRLSDEPLYALAGGLHLPVTTSRLKKGGVQLQMLLGTGKPPWERVGEQDIDRTIETINAAAPARVLLSAHDTCDHAIERIRAAVTAEVDVLRAGERYSL